MLQGPAPLLTRRTHSLFVSKQKSVSSYTNSVCRRWHQRVPVAVPQHASITRTAATRQRLYGATHTATVAELEAFNKSENVKWTKVLWVGNISRELPVESAEATLKAACPWAIHVEVVQFASNTQRSSYPKGSLHRGFALVVLNHPDDALPAANALSSLRLGADPLTAQPALKTPEDWPAEYTLHGDELVQHKKREAERERLRGHRKRNWQRQTAAYQQQLGVILDALPEPGGMQVGKAYQPLAPVMMDTGSRIEPATSAAASPGTYNLIHWPSMPAACDTITGGNLAMNSNLGQIISSTSSNTQEEVPARTLRKRLQVESFLLLLLQLMHPDHMASCQDAAALKAYIRQLVQQAGSASTSMTAPQMQRYSQYRDYEFVEFGCGTGNLVLALSQLLPNCQFHAIDMKWRSVELLEHRAKAAGLSNVTAAVGRIEQYEGQCDIALALHACGSASDYAMLQAARCRAAYVVSPCCVGKLQASLAAVESASSSCDQQDGNGNGRMRLVHPRSRWMVGGLTSLPLAESFRALAQAADYSHTDNHGHPELAALCKSNIELDRSMAALEDGYHTALVKLLQPELTTKSDVLVGAPDERIGQKFAWWWQ